jgi:hypothetical protein
MDPYTCMISNFPSKLKPEVLATYELVPSFMHQGYAAKIKMLNSLKRYNFE